MALTKARLQTLTGQALTARLGPFGFERCAVPTARAKVGLRRRRAWGYQQVTWEALGRPAAGLTLSIGLYLRCDALEQVVAPYLDVVSSGVDPDGPTLLWALSHLDRALATATARDEDEARALVERTAEAAATLGLASLAAFDDGDAPFAGLAAKFLDGEQLAQGSPAVAVTYAAALTRWRPDRRAAVLARNDAWFADQERHGPAWSALVARHRLRYDALLAWLDAAPPP